jgi:hypothetical protein
MKITLTTTTGITEQINMPDLTTGMPLDSEIVKGYYDAEQKDWTPQKQAIMGQLCAGEYLINEIVS